MAWAGGGIYLGLNAARVGHELEDLSLGLLEGWAGDVGHEDAGALLCEEDGRLEADAPVSVSTPSGQGMAALLTRPRQ